MKTILSGSAIAITALVALSGCLKSPDDTTPPTPKAYISIMHLAQTAPSVDVYFDNDKVSNTPFAPRNVTSAYNAVDKGAFSIKFKKANSDSLVAQVPVAEYDSSKYYTIFIYNLQANGPANAVRIKDDFTDLLANMTKPYYRFFHGSPDTGPVDFYIDNVKVESGRTNADNSQQEILNKFLVTTTGFHSLQAKLAGTDTLVATLNGVDLVAGNAYTFYLMGLSGSSGLDQASIGVLRAND